MYADWLKNEYDNWVNALNESTVNNFKEHSMVNRMLGEIEPELFIDLLPDIDLTSFTELDNLGRAKKIPLSGTGMRMIFYALKVLEINPKSIIEIGGGVGQFYATLRLLGYAGEYFIQDLKEVKDFQYKYLKEVENGFDVSLLQLQMTEYDLCVSFYALGEFDDMTKKHYVDNVLPKCKKGFIVWNPHSGANTQILFECEARDEYPIMNEGNKILTWV